MISVQETQLELYSSRLFSFGASRLFFVGGLLAATGVAVLLFLGLANISFSDIFNIAMGVLPVVGIWVLFAASKKMSTKGAFAALSLFRASAIVRIILIG